MLKKCAYWLRTTRVNLVVVFTDHKSIVGLQKQLNITNLTAALIHNKKLVRVIKTINIFDFRVLYKPGKYYIIPNILLRLVSK
jgi:hypothetical protein